MAIVKFLEEGINFFQLGSKISFVTNEVFPSSDGNQVVEIGYYKFINANDSILNSGNYMVLFEKRNERYISVREKSVSDISFQ